MREITQAVDRDIARAVGQLPSGTFVMSSHFEGRRAGIIVRGVQVCAEEPLLVAVAVRCGHWIDPLIRDSRAFAVWRVDAGSGLLLKRFSEPNRPKHGDPFDGLSHTTLATGSPVATSSGLVLDCEVVRHLDLEADHELFVGRVVAARAREAGAAGVLRAG